jgi:hypothetical protein
MSRCLNNARLVLALLIIAKPVSAISDEGSNWTVKDSIEMARLPSWIDGFQEGDPFKYSPNGQLVAFIVLRPRVHTAVTEATLTVFGVDGLRQAIKKRSRLPGPIFEITADSDNLYPAIRQITWSARGDLAFIVQEDRCNVVDVWIRKDFTVHEVARSDATISRLLFLGGGDSIAFARLVNPPQRQEETSVERQQ